MRNAIRFVGFVTALVLFVGTTACGKSSSPIEPSPPPLAGPLVGTSSLAIMTPYGAFDFWIQDITPPPDSAIVGPIAQFGQHFACTGPASITSIVVKYRFLDDNGQEYGPIQGSSGLGASGGICSGYPYGLGPDPNPVPVGNHINVRYWVQLNGADGPSGTMDLPANYRVTAN